MSDVDIVEQARRWCDQVGRQLTAEGHLFTAAELEDLTEDKRIVDGLLARLAELETPSSLEGATGPWMDPDEAPLDEDLFGEHSRRENRVSIVRKVRDESDGQHYWVFVDPHSITTSEAGEPDRVARITGAGK